MDLSSPIIPPLACTPELIQRVPGRIGRWGDSLVAASNKYGLDFYLLCAIMDRESGGGIYLKPQDETGTGDWGRRGGKLPPDGLGWGRGLMQIDFESNVAWCSMVDSATGKFLWQLAPNNIDKGGEIFTGKMTVLNGDLISSIAAYNAGAGHKPGDPAFPDEPEGSGVLRVLANLPWDVSLPAKQEALDAITTGHNYVSDVLRRRDSFLPAGALV